MAGSRDADQRREFEGASLAYLDGLHGLALRLTRSTQEAEDLVQETYLRAYRFQSRFEPGTNMKAWLYRILTNLFINRYRRRVHETRLLDGPESSGIAEATVSREAKRLLEDPEGLFEEPIFGEKVAEAIEGLPEEFRIVVWLADVEELPYREIAEVVGCPIGTVMSRLHRGRKLLRKTFAEHARAFAIGHEDGDAPPRPTEDREDGAVPLDEYRRKRNAG